MLENNSTRLIFAAIAVVIGGVIYGTVNAAYPEATPMKIKMFHNLLKRQLMFMLRMHKFQTSRF